MNRIDTRQAWKTGAASGIEAFCMDGVHMFVG